jgi:hypothetical protein
MGFIVWLKNRRDRAELRRIAWENIDRKEDNSLTAFQNQCNKELLETFENSRELIKKQNIEGLSEKYILGTLPNSGINYWIYEDGAQLGDYPLEREDYDTPQNLINDFITRAKKTEDLTNCCTRSA